MPQAANHGFVIDPEALYIALDAHRRHLQRETGKAVSWRQVGLEIGVGSMTFSRLGVDHGNLHANVLVKLLVWMGQTDMQPYIRYVERDTHET